MTLYVEFPAQDDPTNTNHDKTLKSNYIHMMVLNHVDRKIISGHWNQSGPTTGRIFPRASR